MTNKKLKLAAMSVALTACVAAQPMAAHAVEGPDSVEDNAAPQAGPAPVEGKTAEGEVEGEEEKQEEVRNEKAEDAVDTIGGDDITVDYDHSKDTVTDNEDGSTTTDSTGTVNRDTSEEKGKTGDPAPTTCRAAPMTALRPLMIRMPKTRTIKRRSAPPTSRRP